jgi:HK97 family phage major capsid protein
MPVKPPAAIPGAREKNELGAEIPILFRDFEILSMTPVKRRTEEEKAAAAARRAAGTPGEGEEDDEENAAEGERDADTFDISISSEYPVERWFGKEILDHSAASVDLSRAKLGLSFLDSHDAKSVIGIVEKAKVGDDKKLRGKLRFSRSAPAQAVKQDIQDGIRRFVSVGYGVNEYTLDKSSKDEGDTYRATKWTPMEVSSVGIPADPTVGHDRKDGERTFPVVLVGTKNSPASKPNLREVTVAITIEESRTAAAEIIRLGKLHGIDHERVAKMVGDGLTVEQASREILSDVEKRGAKPLAQPAPEEADKINLSEKEQRDYNIARGIMTAVANIENASNPSSTKRENCLEMEISEEIEKAWKGARHGGLFVPWSIRHSMTPETRKRLRIDNISERAGLDSKTTTAGAELVFTEPGEFIQFLYNRMRVKELGARTISGLRENVSYPKQTGRVTGYWVPENPGVDVADSALTLGSILSSPKTYQSSTSYSRQLLAQSIIDIDSLVREDLARDLALAVDTAAISGLGSSNQPRGILNTTGVQSEVVAADTGNGGLVTYPDIVDMEVKLETANADQLGDPGWLTTPRVKGLLKRTARLGNTIGVPLWDKMELDGIKAVSTNQIPGNGTKGTGTNLAVLILGVWNTLIIGMWGSGFEIVVDPYRLKKQGMIELTTFMLTDITLTYPQAFVVASAVALS